MTELTMYDVRCIHGYGCECNSGWSAWLDNGQVWTFHMGCCRPRYIANWNGSSDIISVRCIWANNSVTALVMRLSITDNEKCLSLRS